ncbi:PEP-CTERM sorting domain-containing protein [Trichocoleus sp. FACHB-262]|uniref:PEP-CTERM sorting domain-containing protein n=1 Tax=Trichocoleus sp. FACHB-262 TaxID=2692869 RepID=UPI0016821E19|nr:PEP-CTERM sorting domain-containing protein [Trichocoleus sp. FACHB-262]MBD2122526.1 PEP-CTERM sorting domain-containing protein [Trichocoleus sp. FACHB-262]
MFPFIRSIATVAAGLALGANLLQAGSAQAASFYDFNIQWDDNTATTGWFEVDDTPDYQYQYQDPYWGSDYSYSYKNWSLSSLLDASFTHKGTAFGKSDLSHMYLDNYDFPAGGYYQPLYGNVANFLNLGFSAQSQYSYLYAYDTGVDGSPALNSDYGYTYQHDNNYNYYSSASARAVSITERSAEAVPEPTTLAGLALAGVGIAASRRKQQRKIAA